MANEKLIITISTSAGQGLTVDTQALSDEAASETVLYETAPAGSSAQPSAKGETAPAASALQAIEVASKAKPWEDLSEKPTGMNFQPDAALHAKMNWICNNVPRMSRLRILREAADMFCDQLIAKHYKE